MWGIFLIIAGIVLRANETWFNGADTVGLVALIAGIVILALQLLVILTAGVTAKRSFDRF